MSNAFLIANQTLQSATEINAEFKLPSEERSAITRKVISSISGTLLGAVFSLLGAVFSQILLINQSRDSMVYIHTLYSLILR